MCNEAIIIATIEIGFNVEHLTLVHRIGAFRMLFGICAAQSDIYRAYDGIIIDSKGHKECFLHENRLVRLLTRLMTLRTLPNVFIILAEKEKKNFAELEITVCVCVRAGL